MASTGEEGALVIGGGSGIGAATAELYRARDVPTTVWDVAGPYDVHCDIARPEEIERALHETMKERGLPRWVTITAGIGHSGLLTETSPDDWDRVMQVNVRGPWLCLRALARSMIEAGSPGSMVATSSVSAHLVDRAMGAYCASKAALSMLVRVAAFEWGSRHIRVNAVGPGVTQTPMLGGAPVTAPWLAGVSARTPLARLGQPRYSPIDSYGEVLRMRQDR